MNQFNSGLPILMRLRKPVSLLLAIAISVTAVAAIAVQDVSAQTEPACSRDMSRAVSNAVKTHNNINDAFMNEATGSMQNAVSTNNSCIGDAAWADIDLSKMIPDFGLIAAALASALEKLAKGVFNRVCKEINTVVQTTAGTWNGAVGDINKKTDADTPTKKWARDVDYQVDGAVNKNIGSTTTPTAPLPTVVAPPPVCVKTLNGRICSDTSLPVPEQNPGPNTNSSAAYIGAEFARRNNACSAAVNRYRSYSPDPNSNAPLLPNLSEVRTVCGDLQTFINTNATLIPPNSITSYPEFPITTPSNIGANLYDQRATTNSGSSPSSSGMSLPVRQ